MTSLCNHTMTRRLYMAIRVNFAGTVPMMRIAHVHPNRDLLLSLCINAHSEGSDCSGNTLYKGADKNRILAELRQQEYNRQMHFENHYNTKWLYFVEEVPNEINDNNHPLA